ncbi:unnamed protein product [Mytilus coruscus]|uniref:Uncharacterized protein n=1 Tax=Mytilus coruscus TaxID=42192 RepID=A0A6J8EMC8_MYTCO|nr:unnamed protein product [Mytilus coruscus]
MEDIADEYVVNDFHKHQIQQAMDEIHRIKVTGNMKFCQARKAIFKQKASLKRKIDEYADELIDVLKVKWTNFQAELSEKMEKLHDNSEHNCTEGAVFFQQHEEPNSSLNELGKLNLDHICVPKFTPGKEIKDNFGIIEDKYIHYKDKYKTKFKIRRHYNIGLSYINYIGVCSDDSLWLCDTVDPTGIHRIEFEGSDRKGVARFYTNEFKINGIAVLPTDDLLVATAGSVIKRVDYITGLVSDTNYNVSPLHTRSVHITRNEHVLVAAMAYGTAYKFPVSGHRVVYVFDKKGVKLAMHEYDKFGAPLFQIPYSLTSTNNRNISIADFYANGGKGRVIVINETGSVLNIYSGHPDISRNALTPVGLTTTEMDTIIVSDMNSHTLHILNDIGQLLTYVNTMEAKFPYCTTFNTYGKLYLGCSAPIGKSDKVKLYEIDLSIYKQCKTESRPSGLSDENKLASIDDLSILFNSFLV